MLSPVGLGQVELRFLSSRDAHFIRHRDECKEEHHQKRGTFETWQWPKCVHMEEGLAKTGDFSDREQFLS